MAVRAAYSLPEAYADCAVRPPPNWTVWAGATAREAVKAAIQLSRGSGPPIKTLRLG